jgi:hypothetical protein
MNRQIRVHQVKTLANKKRSVCSHDSSSAKPAQVGADYPQANDRTIFWPMLAHTADRQQLGSSPGFTFQEVGVCVVPMNQEETRSLEIFDIVYSSGLSSLGVPGGAMAPPDLCRSVYSISISWGILCPPKNTATRGFSDLPTALLCLQTNSRQAHCAVCDFAKIFPITIKNLFSTNLKISNLRIAFINIC